MWKCVEKCQKVWKSAETILPFSCCPLVFLWMLAVDLLNVFSLGPLPSKIPLSTLVDISDIFYFFLLGEWEGEFEAPEGGGIGFFIENARKGAGILQEGEGPGGCLQQITGFWGGGGKYFFSGPKCPPSHSNITDRLKILGELISVKITARLPTKMFPELFFQDYRNHWLASLWSLSPSL